MARDDRKTLIADAVIATLAAAGGRGLTHRAVDAAAGLPVGSTSYYFPTRSALLAAAVHRLTEVDAAQLSTVDESEPVVFITDVIRSALTDGGRERTLARYELSLEAVRRPELREALAGGTAVLERIIVAGFTALAPSEEAMRQARDLLAVIDGVLFSEVTGANAVPRSPDDIRRIVEWAVEPLASQRARVSGS